MKHEIITLQDQQIIGMSREISFMKGPEECPKFWDQYAYFHEVWLRQTRLLMEESLVF